MAQRAQRGLQPRDDLGVRVGRGGLLAGEQAVCDGGRTVVGVEQGDLRLQQIARVDDVGSGHRGFMPVRVGLRGGDLDLPGVDSAEAVSGGLDPDDGLDVEFTAVGRRDGTELEGSWE